MDVPLGLWTRPNGLADRWSHLHQLREGPTKYEKFYIHDLAVDIFLCYIHRLLWFFNTQVIASKE